MYLYSQAPISLPNSEVERLYDFPRVIDSTWVQANFVASLDGAATVDGDSEILSSGANRNLLAIVRDLSDAVLVGVTTAVVGRYERLRTDADRRHRHGLGRQPLLAVVTNRCSLIPDSPLIHDSQVAPIIGGA